MVSLGFRKQCYALLAHNLVFDTVFLKKEIAWEIVLKRFATFIVVDQQLKRA